MTGLLIEELTPDHWPQVAAIYQDGISSGDATFETEIPSWEVWDTNHFPHSRLIAMVSGKIAGWAALSPVSKRVVYQGVAEVSVYVASTAQRRGVGTTLLGALVLSSEQNGVWTLQAGIFPENEVSLYLHKKHGFRVVGRRERIGLRAGIWRDVILMERRSQVAGV
jgi:phosphinothricin acetyltransferase